MEKLTNFSSEVTLKDCENPGKIGMLSSNGTYTDLNSFLECALLSKGPEGFRQLQINPKFIDSSCKTKDIPQLLGYMTMFGIVNNTEDSLCVLSEAINSEDHTLVPQNSICRENICLKIISDNEEIDIEDKLCSRICIAQLDIWPLNLDCFNEVSLKRIQHTMLNSRQSDGTSFGNKQFWQFSPIVMFEKNPVFHINCPDNQKESSLISKLKIKKHIDHSATTNKQNGARHSIACMFREAPAIIINPNKSFKLAVDCMDGNFRINNQSYSNKPNDITCNSEGVLGMYGVVTNLIGHECLSLGKFLDSPESLKLLSETLSISSQMRNNAVYDLPEYISSYSFAHQTIGAIENIVGNVESAQKYIYAYDDPKASIAGDKFAKTLHVTRLNFVDNIVDNSSNSDGNSKNKQIEVKHIMGKIEDLVVVDPDDKEPLFALYSLEQIDINCSLLNRKNTLIIPINSVGSQLVCNAKWKNSKTGVQFADSTHTSVLMPGPHFLIIKKRFNQLEEYVSVLAAPVARIHFNGSKNRLYKNGLYNVYEKGSQNVQKLLHDTKQHIATQFSRSEVFKQPLEPATVLMSRLNIAPHNYLPKHDSIIALDPTSKAHIQNAHILPISGTSVPKEDAYIKHGVLKQNMIPIYLSSSIKPSKASYLQYELNGHSANVPSVGLALNIVESNKDNTNYEKIKVIERNSLEECLQPSDKATECVKFISDKKGNQIIFMHTDKYGTNLTFKPLPNIFDHKHICSADNVNERMHLSKCRESEILLSHQSYMQITMCKNITHGIDIYDAYKSTFGECRDTAIANIVTKVGSFQRNPLSPLVMPAGVPMYKSRHSHLMDETFKYEQSTQIIYPAIAGLQSFIAIYPMKKTTYTESLEKSQGEIIAKPICPLQHKRFATYTSIKKLYNLSLELTTPSFDMQFGHTLLAIAKILKQATKLILNKGRCYQAMVDEMNCKSNVNIQNYSYYKIEDWEEMLAQSLRSSTSYEPEKVIIRFLNYGLLGLMRQTIMEAKSIEHIILYALIIPIAHNMLITATKLCKINKTNPRINPILKKERINMNESKIGLEQSRNMLSFAFSCKHRLHSVYGVICDTIACLNLIPTDVKEEIIAHIINSFISSILNPDLEPRRIVDLEHDKKYRLGSKKNQTARIKPKISYDEAMIIGDNHLSDIIINMKESRLEYFDKAQKILVDLKIILESMMSKQISSYILKETIDTMNNVYGPTGLTKT